MRMLIPLTAASMLLFSTQAQANNGKAKVNCNGEMGSILAGTFVIDQASNNTSDYLSSGLNVARQGGDVSLILTFDKNPERACFDFDMALVDDFTGLEVAFVDFQPTTDVAVEGGDFTQSYRATFPSDLPVGRYHIEGVLGDGAPFVVLDGDDTTSDDTSKAGSLPSDIYMTYAWWADAAGHYDVWTGKTTQKVGLDDVHSLTFEVDPFAREAVVAAIDAIGHLSADERRDKATVVTALGRATSNDRLLWGRWDGKYNTENSPGSWLTRDYNDGKKPWEWTGSTEIFKRVNNGGQVKYGQCWVFSGLLAAQSRALGLPTRTVTNMDSAHEHAEYRGDYRPSGRAPLMTTASAVIFDTDEDGTQTFSKEKSSDSIWTFHVWNEVYLRDGEPAADSNLWNAYDSTPQEESDGSLVAVPTLVQNIKDGIAGDAYTTSEDPAPRNLAICDGSSASLKEGVFWGGDFGSSGVRFYSENGVSVWPAGTTAKAELTFEGYPDGACGQNAFWLEDQLLDGALVPLKLRPVSDAVIQDGFYTRTFNATLPPAAPAGAYRAAGGDPAAPKSIIYWEIGGASQQFIHLIFDPTNPNSPAFLAEADRAYRGASTAKLTLDDANTLSFDIDPYTPEAMAFAMDALYGSPQDLRRDPVGVSRLINQGIASGEYASWGAPTQSPLAWLNLGYSDGKKPWEWTGSTEILSKAGNGKVKYGQCWVFAGLMTTANRAVGIGSRPVTGYDFVSESGRDYGASYHLGTPPPFHTTSASVVYKVEDDGTEIFSADQSRPSIWSFHVWTEAYMTRSDMPSGTGNGWQAFDTTFQEASNRKSQVGPAPVSQITDGTWQAGPAFKNGPSTYEREVPIY